MSKEMNIFEYAVRNKLRFPYRGGNFSRRPVGSSTHSS